MIRALVATLTAALLVGTTTPAHATTSATPTILTMPTAYGGRGQAYAMINEVTRLIDHTPPGATIRHLGYLLTTPDPVNAMIRAHRRGVHIKVTVDKHATGPLTAKLATELGRNRNAESFLYTVKASGFSRAASGAYMHGKLTQISTAGNRRYINVVSSANLAVTNAEASSNATEVFDDRTLYASAHKFFDAVTADENRPSYYRKATSGNVQLHMGPGMPAVVYAKLGRVTSCRGVTINVAQFQWSDATSAVKIATRLWGLAARGCNVNVAINYSPNRVLIGTRTAAALLKRKNGHQIVEVRNVRKPGVIYIHNKQLVIVGPSSSTVFSGSKNFNGNDNADILTVNSARSVADAYQVQFAKLWKIGTPMTTVPHYTGIAATNTGSGPEWDEAE
jgi:hypothetical protein